MKGEITVKNKYKHRPSMYDFYIGRGSALGNPFPIDDKNGQTRDVVIERYRSWLTHKINEENPTVLQALNKLAEISLRGDPVNLVCFCAPKRCHGDIIKRVVEDAIKSK